MTQQNPLFLSLADDSWQRAHYGFVVATGALSLGRPVTLFAGGCSVWALETQSRGLKGAFSDEKLTYRNVPSLHELRDAFFALGGKAIACETGLKMAHLTPERLVDGTRVAGIVSFLDEVGTHPIMAL